MPDPFEGYDLYAGVARADLSSGLQELWIGRLGSLLEVERVFVRPEAMNAPLPHAPALAVRPGSVLLARERGGERAGAVAAVATVVEQPVLSPPRTVLWREDGSATLSALGAHFGTNWPLSGDAPPKRGWWRDAGSPGAMLLLFHRLDMDVRTERVVATNCVAEWLASQTNEHASDFLRLLDFVMRWDHGLLESWGVARAIWESIPTSSIYFGKSDPARETMYAVSQIYYSVYDDRRRYNGNTALRVVERMSSADQISRMLQIVRGAISPADLFLALATKIAADPEQLCAMLRSVEEHDEPVA